jgi:hypothetical protein
MTSAVARAMWWRYCGLLRGDQVREGDGRKLATEPTGLRESMSASEPVFGKTMDVLALAEAVDRTAWPYGAELVAAPAS